MKSFKTVEELDKFCSSFKYGVRTTDGKYITTISDFNKHTWVLQSPEQVEEHKIGICWDVTLFVSTCLKHMNIKHECFFIWNNNHGKLENTHSFNVFMKNGKYFVFDVFGPNKGISAEFTTQIDAIKNRTMKWKKEEHIDGEMHCTKLTSFPKSGSTPKQFIESATKQTYIELELVDAQESFEASNEALTDKGKDKRKRITEYIIKVMNTLDPTGDNGKRYADQLGNMSDNEFIQFMDYIAKHKTNINIVMPNMKKTLRIPDIIKALQLVNMNVYHKLWLQDRTTGRKYLTNEKYLVLQLPIRRAQQEVDKKLSVPSRDQRIDALTGQVTGPDKACALSAPEIQSLNTRGLEATLNELVRVRGGDINAYGDLKRQLEETGGAELNALDPRTRTRSSVITGVLLTALLLDNNL